MIRQQHSTANQSNEANELLDQLLHAPLPSSKTLFRPATLRSTGEQRRIALRSFLLRTWFDHTLFHLERVLVVALAAFFVYWLADGYGRDWLYQLRGPAAAAQPAASQATTAPTQTIADREPAQAAVALPFTTPRMAEPPAVADYLSPQMLAAPDTPLDQRPNRLIIPAINVDTPVKEVFIENGAWQVADYAAGYHHGTALPGTVGNTVMAGHAGLRGGVFRDLGMLQVGDEIVVETQGWRYRYRVRESKSVWPTQVEVMAPTPTPVLTLITCTAWDTQRLIIVADLIDSRPLA